MTFDEIVDEIMKDLHLTSDDAEARVQREVNEAYATITSKIGMAVSRRAVVETNAVIGSDEVTFVGIEKVLAVFLPASDDDNRDRVLEEVSFDEIRNDRLSSGDRPYQFAVKRMRARSVTIKLDRVAETAYDISADGYENAQELSGDLEPAFPASFHYILVHWVEAKERRKMEKLQLALDSERQYKEMLSDLQYFIAKSAYQDIYQNKANSRGSFRWRRGYWNTNPLV